METRRLEDFKELEENYASEVPEDVAILYTWANLEGAKYQDFSAERREQRAQMRHRAAEQLRLSESKARSESHAAARQVESEAAAHAEAKRAEQASRTTDLDSRPWADSNESRSAAWDQDWDSSYYDAESKHGSLRTASQQARKAAVEREAAARAESMVRRQEQEIADARASAIRQAARYAEAGLRGRLATSVDSDANMPRRTVDQNPLQRSNEDDTLVRDGASTIGDAYRELEGAVWEAALEDEAAGRFRETGLQPERIEGVTPPSTTHTTIRPSTMQHATEATAKHESKAEVVQRIPSTDEAAVSAHREESKSDRAIEPSWLYEVTTHAMSELFESEPVSSVEIAFKEWTGDEAELHRAAEVAAVAKTKAIREMDSRARRAAGPDVPGPAWLYPKQHASGMRSLATAQAAGDVPESLDHSKERIAARWFALRSVFARHDTDRSGERVAANPKNRQAPIVAVFSIAGGAGKTSLVATLGRALSFLGEKVLLSDTTAHGLLPFYFGASQLVSGVVRTFSPPAGSTDAPIHLVSYESSREIEEAEGQAGVVDNLLENSQRANRVLLDLGMNSSKMVARLGQFKPTILVPLMPDMNSVISIDGVEKLFGSMLDGEGRPLQPVYLLNQFDAALPLHLDIREVLKQQLGERLLPFVIRRSAAVGEALAEGMTVVDYDPGSPVAEDYLRVANWLRSVSAPVAVGFRNQRWSEQ